jgi:hypothetical protein
MSSNVYETDRKNEASLELACFRSIIGKQESINICEKYIYDGINNDNNDLLSLIFSKLLFDDSTYFRYVLISFQKNGIIIDPDEIIILDNILSTLNEEIQTLYKPIVKNLLNKPFDDRMPIIYGQIKKRLIEEYIDFFTQK